MSIETALQALRFDPRFMRNVTRWVREPARAARYAPLPAQLDARLAAVTAKRGLAQLYTHQAEAVSAALDGKHVAVVTPAASGKTLCYNLPVLQHLLADPNARALYLYPTKALAQDQLAELHRLVEAIPLPVPLVATYDGDTPSAQRAKVRESARIVLSNPDMLHTGILPQHPRWAAFFANLRAVVIDEMHVYRGVFGSHVADVLRRLRRICRFYGSQPQFFLASATIANPSALAERLVEEPVIIVGPERNGAPQGEKEILFYNPPLVDPALGIRRSSNLEATDLAAHFLAHDVQTIVFARARLTTELILTYLREAAEEGLCGETQGKVKGAPRSVRGYRGGYLPSERREIERGLREGHVRGVVATNALELGIDIGQLGAAVLAGYPGTIASTRQQMGRAGRRQGTSVGVLVASVDPVDQYLIAHPEYLLESSPEHARLNPDNEVILASHLACAAAELPIEAGESFGTGTVDLHRVLAELVEAGQLHRGGDRFFWAGAGSPAAAISLRSSSPASQRVIIQSLDAAGGQRVIGEVERASVLRLVYEGAVYLHESASYLVERLDWEAGIASVRPVEVDFYTRPIVGTEVEVLAVKATAAGRESPTDTPTGYSAEAGHAALRIPRSVLLSWGDVRVVSRATGYKILRRITGEMLGYGQIDLPEQAIETEACWLSFSEELVDQLKAAGLWFSDPNHYGPNWRAQRDAARSRDGYRCQYCGMPEINGQQHDVHHRIPFRAFVAAPTLRGDLLPDEAWQVANVLENLVTLCPACHRRAEASVRIRSGLGGVAALLAGVAPLFLMCDPGDLGLAIEPQAPDSGLPTITIYEQTPGGVGYAEQLYRSMPELLAAARDLVQMCPCAQGCPSCVGPVLEHDYALDAKALAQAILDEIAALPTAATVL